MSKSPGRPRKYQGPDWDKLPLKEYRAKVYRVENERVRALSIINAPDVWKEFDKTPIVDRDHPSYEKLMKYLAARHALIMTVNSLHDTIEELIETQDRAKQEYMEDYFQNEGTPLTPYEQLSYDEFCIGEWWPTISER